MKRHYQIHGLSVCLEVKAAIPWFFHKLRYFEVDGDIANPDLHIAVGPFELDVAKWQNCDHAFYSNGDNLYFTNTWMGLEWKTAWHGITGDRIRVQFDFNSLGVLFFPWLMALDWVLYWFVFKPCSELLWARRKRFVVHASGCSGNGRGMLFTGFGSGLKTSFAMKLVKSGYGFLGDDQILVDATGMHCLPISLETFRFRAGRLDDEYLTPFRLLRLARHLLASGSAPSEPEIEIAGRSPITDVTVVIRTNRAAAAIRDIPYTEAANRALFNCLNETLVNIRSRHPIYAPFRAMDILFPDFDHESIWRGLSDCLLGHFRGSRCRLLEMKPKWDDSYMRLVSPLDGPSNP